MVSNHSEIWPRSRFQESRRHRILQGCGSVFIFYGSGSGSRVWCWRPFRIRIRIQYGSRVLMTKNWKKITAEIFLKFFFDQKLLFTYPYASIKYVQVIEEAFSSQKRPSNTSKHELLQIIVFFCGSFLPSASTGPIESGSNPDPEPWLLRKNVMNFPFAGFRLWPGLF